MSIVQISSRQFREKQKAFLDLADKGEQIVIRRRSKQAYLLTPINDDDLFFTPEMLEKVDNSVRQAKNGKVRELTPELQKELLGL